MKGAAALVKRWCKVITTTQAGIDHLHRLDKLLDAIQEELLAKTVGEGALALMPYSLSQRHLCPHTDPSATGQSRTKLSAKPSLF